MFLRCPCIQSGGWRGGDISLCFGWSFFDEQPGRGTILTMLGLSRGLARGCRVSGGSGHVSVRSGVSHLQPTCLVGSAVWKQIPPMSLCNWDRSNMLVCKEMPEISLPWQSPHWVPGVSLQEGFAVIFLMHYRGLKFPSSKRIYSNVPLMDHSHSNWSE